jgi:transcriptional regulator with XRE-family HTH domain
MEWDKTKNVVYLLQMKSQRHYEKLLKIGTVIAKTRKELGYSQTELATMAGIHRVRLSEIENGASSSIVTLFDILTAINKMDLFDSVLKPTKSKYDKAFDEISSSVVSSVHEMKGQRHKERSSVQFPDNKIYSNGK